MAGGFSCEVAHYSLILAFGAKFKKDNGLPCPVLYALLLSFEAAEKASNYANRKGNSRSVA